MEENFRFHPAVETAIRYFCSPHLSMQDLAAEFGISKQAVSKRINAAEAYFAAYGRGNIEGPEVSQLRNEVERLQGIILIIRRQLLISATLLFLADCLKNRIQKFFPRFRLTRLWPDEKKHILDMYQKFSATGGLLKDFCKGIGKSSETIARWLRAYEKYGMGGLADKKTTPHHFSNKIPAWLMRQLLVLFTKFPQWTPYQYHKYIMNNPAIQWRISVPTIKKIQEIHRKKTADEMARIKKRWCFAPGTAAWVIDFTTILKTSRYSLKLLTISDQRSRYLFESALFLETSTEKVMDHLENLFIKYGKPFMVKADGGPEFRLSFRDDLEKLSIHLLRSPPDYGQFNGAHERIHRELKGFITSFHSHHNITLLADEIRGFTEDHNHYWTYDCLNKRTPAEVFYSDPDFIPKDTEVITPYRKDGELRMKFTNREGKPARLAIPLISPAISGLEPSKNVPAATT